MIYNVDAQVGLVVNADSLEAAEALAIEKVKEAESRGLCVDVAEISPDLTPQSTKAGTYNIDVDIQFEVEADNEDAAFISATSMAGLIEDVFVQDVTCELSKMAQAEAALSP